MPRVPTLRQRWRAIVAVLPWIFPAGLVAQAPAVSPVLVGRVNTIREQTVREHVAFLASDALLGRDTPSPGLERAAAYLVARYREWGVSPAGEGRGYVQRFSYQDGSVPNVLAMIPGRDPRLRNEYVVLSAHLDHVGVGIPVQRDSIYNGADDNASGTAALLEVARALASLPESDRPRRTVIFAHVSGEEKGLLGSAWWVDHPTVPIQNVVADVNVDMVGGDAHPDTVAALGGEFSSLGPLIRQVAVRLPELGLTVSGDLWPQEGLFFRSDQFNFMRREIPALFIFNGLHECYHRPCDDIDFVSIQKIVRVARLIAHTVVEIANQDAGPSWNPGALDEVRRITSFGG